MLTGKPDIPVWYNIIEPIPTVGIWTFPPRPCFSLQPRHTYIRHFPQCRTTTPLLPRKLTPPSNNEKHLRSCAFTAPFVRDPCNNMLVCQSFSYTNSRLTFPSEWPQWNYLDIYKKIYCMINYIFDFFSFIPTTNVGVFYSGDDVYYLFEKKSSAIEEKRLWYTIQLSFLLIVSEIQSLTWFSKKKSFGSFHIYIHIIVLNGIDQKLIKLILS